MSSGIYEGKPFNEKQLKGIARWILEESNSPMDELHDLLFDSMYNQPKVFEHTWEDIVEENDLKENYIDPPITQGDIMLNKMLKE